VQIINKREKVHVEQYSLVFNWRDQSGAGFSFPCTKDGKLLWNEIPLTAIESLQACLKGQIDVVPVGVQDHSFEYWLDAVGRCSTCGKDVLLENPFTNECGRCGALYNGFGQELAPRSQWDPRGDY